MDSPGPEQSRMIAQMQRQIDRMKADQDKAQMQAQMQRQIDQIALRAEVKAARQDAAMHAAQQKAIAARLEAQLQMKEVKAAQELDRLRSDMREAQAKAALELKETKAALEKAAMVQQLRELQLELSHMKSQQHSQVSIPISALRHLPGANLVAVPEANADEYMPQQSTLQRDRHTLIQRQPQAKHHQDQPRSATPTPATVDLDADALGPAITQSQAQQLQHSTAQREPSSALAPVQQALQAEHKLLEKPAQQPPPQPQHHSTQSSAAPLAEVSKSLLATAEVPVPENFLYHFFIR